MDRFALSVYIAVVTAWYAVVRVDAQAASFSANTHYRPPGNPVRFDVITINRGNHLDASTFSFTVPSEGVYLGMLTAGVVGGSSLNMEYQSYSTNRFSCYREQQNQEGHDTYGRDVLLWFRAGKVLTAFTGGDTYSTPTGLLTSWGTASLQIGSVAFSVARYTNFPAGPVSYPYIYFDTSGAWDTSNNQFIAPRDGAYFFCFATRVDPGMRADFDLLVNGQERVDIYRMSTAHIAPDSLSRSAMMYLFEGDRVAIASGYPGVTNSNNHTTFSGFLYEPPTNQRYAWGVYRSSSWSYATDHVTYNVVLVNEGSLWEIDHVNCPISGVYYVYVSAGLNAQTPVELTVMRNTIPMGSLSRDDTTHNGIDSFGRSMLIECSAGDVLWVSAAPGTELYSSSSLQTSFIGFYLYP